MQKQAIVFLTHIWNRRVSRHFARLKRETNALLDVFLIIDPSANVNPSPSGIHFLLSSSPQDGARVLPNRYAERERKRERISFFDLLVVPTFFSPQLANYNYIWVIEYDVDYAGHWRDFFVRTMGSHGDFLGTTIFPRGDSPDWHFWTWFRSPPEVSRQLRSFNPICRFSRPMIDCYVQALRSTQWQGHMEALWPTIAYSYGLSIEDLGGRGPFCPSPRRDAIYSNNPDDAGLSPGTFVWRPVRHTSYFNEAPKLFSRRDFLYHPVKPELRPIGRLRRGLNRMQGVEIIERLINGREEITAFDENHANATKHPWPVLGAP